MEPSLQILQGLIFAWLISLFSYRARLLTASGAAAQFVLGFVLLGLGGWGWTVPVVVFFLGSAGISRLGRERRSRAERLFVKPGSRDAWQVLANGGVAGVLCAVWALRPDPLLYAASVGSIAAAAADTWGTELGTLSKEPPVLITTLQTVEPGRSGGVTCAGTLAGALGAALVVVTAVPWVEPEAIFAFVTAGVFAGLIGSLVDSALGATVQRSYRCTVCGRVGEKYDLCPHLGRLPTGLPWLTNDAVNLVNTASGGLIAWLLMNALT